MAEEITSLDLLIVFFNKKNYEQYRELVNTDTLDRQTYDILKGLDTYFRKNPQSEQIDIDLFATWFIQFYKVKLSDNDKELFNIIFSNIKTRSQCEIGVDAIIKEFNDRATRKKLLTLIHEGKDFEEIKLALDEFKKEENTVVDYLADGIENLMNVADPTVGLQWRLPVLNKAIGPLAKSVFLVLAGRPDSGKTSFVASEVTHMAQQLKDDEIILWFVTENTKEEAKKRAYCAMLQRPWDDFWEYMSNGKFEAINKSYREKQGGRERIKFAHASDLTLAIMEQEIAKHNTKLVIFDMLDDFCVPKNVLANETQSTAKSKALYKWALDVACKYCPVIATSQLSEIKSDNPDHYRYPYMSGLADSKTDKQAKATVLLYIGRWEHDNRRYLSTPKNKRKCDMSDFRACVQFDSARSIFKPL